MADDTHRFQAKFRQFHEAIKLRNTEENATLREKRDRVLDRMRENLRAQRRTFETFNQGSYAMGTGVKPTDGDYDIDVGVIFSGGQAPEPLTAKRWVYDAVYGHTGSVIWKNPCITVQYQKAGEHTYHVDLPVYWQENGHLYLARGKEHSSSENRTWQHQDPRGFIGRVKTHGDGESNKQFRRVVRALKRWRDVHFPSHGNAAPVGVGLTVLAFELFSPTHNAGWFNTPGERDYDDLAALIAFVEQIRNRFSWSGRISATMPVAPRDDVFARMTDQHMKEFKERLERLAGWLEEARRTGSTNPLRRAFGSAFPE